MALRIASLLFLIGFLASCDVTEGEGGSATIRGKVFARDLDNDGDLKSEYYAPDRDVYIVYGDDDFYGDNVKTHYDGTFKFEYLRTGSYSVYAYSECNSCDVPLVPVIIDTMILNSNAVIDIGDIIVVE